MTAPRAARVETPADTLRRAAKHVRKLGAAATPGPWERALKTRTKSAIQAPTPDDAEMGANGHGVVAICSVPEWSAGMGFLRQRSGRDLDWIAMLGPQIAEPLAVWLDWAAVLSDHAVRAGGPGDMPGLVPALTLARVLLGSPVPEPDGEGTPNRAARPRGGFCEDHWSWLCGRGQGRCQDVVS